VRVVSTVCSPTKGTVHVAVVNCRRHLHASMGFDAVESLFVARSSVNQRFAQPSATLDSRMRTYQVILLVFQHPQKTV
jgi:hypothetical protein